jgi:tetratricopeptide (TPR) repeat protein
MASKVNTRFVVILASVLGVLVLGTAGVLFIVQFRSAERLERLGDAAMQESAYERASDLYGKAFAKTNMQDVSLLEKYRQAIEAWAPTSDTTYDDAWVKYVTATRNIAEIRLGDVEANEAFLNILLETNQFMGGPEGWRHLRDAADAALRNFGPESPAGWERLKRYRGIATARLASTGMLGLDEEEGIIPDLKAAMEADPSDVQVVGEYGEWLGQLAQRAKSKQNREEARRLLDEAVETIDAFLRANPESAMGQVYRLQFLLQRTQGLTSDEGAAAEVSRRIVAAFATHLPDLEEVFTTLERMEPSDLDVRLLQQVRHLEGLIRQDRSWSMALFEKAYEAQRENSLTAIVYGNALHEAGEFEKAIEVFSALADLPRLPVSLAGVMRKELQVQAKLRRLDSAIAMWERASDETRATWQEQVERYRALVEATLGSESVLLTPRLARIAILKGEYGEALRLLVEYNREQADQDVEAIRLEAIVWMQTGSPGRALSRFRQLIALSPGNTNYRMMAAALEQQLGNMEAAAREYREVMAIDPSNTAAQEQYKICYALVTGQPTGDEALDVAIQVQRLVTGAGGAVDLDAALRTINDALGRGLSNVMLHRVRAEILTQMGRNEDAKAAIEAGLSAFPDDPRLTYLQKQASEGALPALIGQIESTETDEATKWAQKYAAYSQAGETEKAAEAARALRAADPQLSRASTVDMLFLEALRVEDFETASRLAAKARELDADNAQGRFYEARLQHARGQTQEAISTLRLAVEEGSASPDIHRLLGELYAVSGRMSDAIASLEAAYSARRNDARIVIPYLSAMLAEGRYADGLRVARESRGTMSQHDRFVELWLQFEGVAGDRQLAIARREAISEQRPEDTANRLTLIRLYFDQKAWDKARVLIDTMRKAGDTLDLVAYDAILNYFTGSAEAGRKVFDDYIASLGGGEIPAEVALRYAQYLIQTGSVDEGIERLRAAWEKHPENPAITEQFGAVLFNQGRYEDALEPLRKGLEFENVTARTMSLSRYTEALVRLDRAKEAEEAIDRAGLEMSNMLQFRLIRSEAARQMGDRTRADEILDEAINAYPDNALPYIIRAQTMLGDPGRARDVIRDLTAAISKDGSNWQAYRLRARAHYLQGHVTNALNDLRTAIGLNPNLNDARMELMKQYIGLGNVVTAQSIAQEAADQRPRDRDLMVQLASVFMEHGLWAEAVPYLEVAFDVSKSSVDGERYAFALLMRNPPNLDLAGRVLNTIQASSPQTSPTWHLTNARLLQLRGSEESARLEMAKAVAQAGNDPRVVGSVLNRIESLIPETADRIAFVNRLDLSAVPEDWAEFMRVLTMMQDRSYHTQVIDRMRSLASRSQDKDLVHNVRLRLSALLLEAKQIDEAVELMRAALEQQPEDPILNNNLAYTLAHDLGRPEEALSYAKRAAERASESPQILDTLGYVHLRLGNLEEAEEVLANALRLAEDPSTQVPTLLHLVELRIAQENLSAARAYLDQASGIVAQSPRVRESNKDRLERLSQELAGRG